MSPVKHCCLSCSRSNTLFTIPSSTALLKWIRRRLILTRLCWFCLLSVNRTKVVSQATRRSPDMGQHATAIGCSDRGISIISVWTPLRRDAPRRRWPNKRTPTRALSSAWVEWWTHYLNKSRRIKSVNQYLESPVCVCSEVGGIIFFLDGHQVITWTRQKRKANMMYFMEFINKHC